MKNKESRIQKACLDYLQLQENLKKLYFFRNNSFAGKILRKDGSAGYINNAKRGAPDAFFFMKDKVCAIEFKSSSGRLSADQKQCKRLLEGFGIKYCVIKSLDELMEIVKNSS